MLRKSQNQNKKTLERETSRKSIQPADCELINRKLDKILEEFNSFKDIIKNLEVICETQKLEIVELKEENSNLKKEVQDIKADYEELDWDLNSEFRKIKNSINKLNQERINQDLVFCGIPIEKAQTKEEEQKIVNAKICQVVAKLNVNVKEEDILDAYRVKSGNIVARFNKNSVRNAIFDAKKNINFKDLNAGIFGGNKFDLIFINEHLTKQNMLLLKHARDARRNGQFKYAWSKYGNIYVKKDDMTEKIMIHHVNDI